MKGTDKSHHKLFIGSEPTACSFDCELDKLLLIWSSSLIVLKEEENVPAATLAASNLPNVSVQFWVR